MKITDERLVEWVDDARFSVYLHGESLGERLRREGKDMARELIKARRVIEITEKAYYMLDGRFGYLPDNALAQELSRAIGDALANYHAQEEQE